MTQREIRVSSDTWVGSGQPNARHGEDEQVRVRAADQVALLWAKIPWDREATVNVTGHALRLVCDGGSTGAAQLTVRGLSDRFVDTEVTWASKPGTTGPTGTLDVTDLDDGEVIFIPATEIGQAIAAGGRNLGVELSTNSATTIRFHSADSPDRPRWVSTWTEQPDAPNVRPAGGIISAQFPTWAFDYDGDAGDLSAVRIQLDPAADSVSPDFDSGEVTSSEALLRTSDTLYPGLASAASVSARGSITVGGVESGLGPWVTVQRITKGGIVVDSPSAGVVTSVTPVILATFTPADGVEALTEQRVQIWDAARETRLYNTRRVPATDANTIAADIPFRDPVSGERILRRKGTETYSLCVEGWGYPDRVDAPEDPAAVEVWVDFTVSDEPLLTAPTGLTADATDGRPSITLTFTIGPDAPDQIVIAADDEIVEVLEPETIHAGGTSYVYEYTGAKPYRDVELAVAQIKDNGMSPWSNAVVEQARPKGLWIIDEGRDLRFRLTGLDVGNWVLTDQGVDYDPVGSPHRVRVVTAQQGMSGHFTGALRDGGGLTYDEQLADLWAIKARPTRLVRLVVGDWSIPVQLTTLSATPHPRFRSFNEAALVQIAFEQRGELPFRSRL